MIIVAHFEEVGCAETTGRGVQNKGDWRGACLDPNFRLLSAGWGALGLLLLCLWCFLSNNRVKFRVALPFGPY